jgi:hypothetical protein
MHSLLGIEYSRTLAQEKDRQTPMTESRPSRSKRAGILRPLPIRRRRTKVPAVARGAS